MPIPEHILTLPQSLLSVEDEALAGLAQADAVRIPAGVTALQESVFQMSDVTLILPWNSSLIPWAKECDFVVLAEP